MLNGVVIKALNSYYYVQEECLVTRCKLRGRFKQERFSLAVGDRVDYVRLEDGTGIIEKIQPRKSMLRRPLVANVDQVILTFAAANPDLNPLLLDRFLTLAESSRLEIMVCINKIDLADQSYLHDLLDLYKIIGYNFLCVSAVQNIGLDALKMQLKDKISVFAGPSGVGKSTLLNAVEPNFSLVTGSLSDKIKRGKHTTRVAELMPFSLGGFVVDTPGFSFTEFEHIEPVDLQMYFPEFRRVEKACKYATCLHKQEPQCAIKESVAVNEISGQRYESYLNILNEIQSKKRGF